MFSLPPNRLVAFPSEVDTGSREENASKLESRASVLTQSEPDHALGVSFQEVVHSALTEEAEVAEASDSEGRTEWTPIRMRL